VLTNAAPDSYSRMTELEAWTPASGAPTRSNLALPANGGAVTASSEWDAVRGASAANNGDRKGLHWGSDPATGSGWHSASTGTAWLQIDFNGGKAIDEIDVFGPQDDYANPIEPTTSLTFNLYSLTGFEVQYWTGSAWATVANGSVTGNNKVWRQFTFTAVTTTKIRVLTTASPDGYSRLTEIEAWGTAAGGGGGASADIQWLVTDQLGTPRILFDKTGSLASTKRLDYLPFGEELTAGQGLRTAARGYNSSDSIRHKFTLNERDNETGLDYFGYRYYGPTLGRWTTVDPLLDFQRNSSEPQAWNQYQYCINNPLNRTDPDGRQDSAELNFERDVQALMKHQITERQFHDRMNARGVGAVVGLAVLASAYLGVEGAMTILMYASQHPDKVEQVAMDLTMASSRSGFARDAHAFRRDASYRGRG
jgi:RHS repeat-associated protein